MTNRRKVVAITDGDEIAARAIKEVAERVGGRLISASAGNPTPLDGQTLVKMVKSAPCDPVLVMFDDRGAWGEGAGEKALLELAGNPEIDLLGVVAVASHAQFVRGVEVDQSVTNSGQLVGEAVDKDGRPVGHKILKGDTVDIVNKLQAPVVVGVGDVGKMGGADSFKKGAPVTTKAVEEILKRSGFTWP